MQCFFTYEVALHKAPVDTVRLNTEIMERKLVGSGQLSLVVLSHPDQFPEQSFNELVWVHTTVEL